MDAETADAEKLKEHHSDIEVMSQAQGPQHSSDSSTGAACERRLVPCPRHGLSVFLQEEGDGWTEPALTDAIQMALSRSCLSPAAVCPLRNPLETPEALSQT